MEVKDKSSKLAWNVIDFFPPWSATCADSSGVRTVPSALIEPNAASFNAAGTKPTQLVRANDVRYYPLFLQTTLWAFHI